MREGDDFLLWNALKCFEIAGIEAEHLIRRTVGRERGIVVNPNGVVEWWSGGVMEWWSGGVVEWWSDGLMDWWIGGLMDWWIDGLVDWWIGGLMDWWAEWQPRMNANERESGCGISHSLVVRFFTVSLPKIVFADGKVFRLVEWWSDGVVEWWSGGVMEWWSGGVMEWWSDGVVEW
jgi:hypothetical protein